MRNCPLNVRGVIMQDKELAFTSAWELRGMMGARKVSSVEVTEVYLQRIEEMNSKLNAYLTVDGEGAMAQAREADGRLAKGDKAPMLGVPIAIKDLELTEGLRTTMGSLVYKDFVPDRDGPVSERVKRAGAV